GLDVVLGEAPAEVAGRGRIGEAPRAQGVEQDLVLAEQVQVLQARAAPQGQVGQGQHMVRFMVGKVDLEQLQATVDGLDQADLANERVHSADAADSDAAAAFADLIVDVAGGHHRFGAAPQVGRVQTALDAALAVGQFLSYLG